jgi:hypothetical protein
VDFALARSEIGCDDLLEHVLDALGTIDDLIAPDLPPDLDDLGPPPGPAPPATTSPRMTSPVYAVDGPYSGASGGWCVPIVAVARVLASLTPGSSVPLYFSRWELDEAARIVPSADDDCDRLTLGFSRDDTEFTYRPALSGQVGVPGPVRRIYKNGILGGCGALLGHQYPESDTADQQETLSFCVIFNQEMELRWEELTEIFNRLQTMETLGHLLGPDRLLEHP